VKKIKIKLKKREKTCKWNEHKGVGKKWKTRKKNQRKIMDFEFKWKEKLG
jgi:hypothetical protein